MITIVHPEHSSGELIISDCFIVNKSIRAFELVNNNDKHIYGRGLLKAQNCQLSLALIAAVLFVLLDGKDNPIFEMSSSKTRAFLLKANDYMTSNLNV